MRGLRVVDLGCGFGWFCRWARAAGAAQVLGFDVSERMLARARATTEDSAITYTRADLEHLQLPEASFDLVYSSLAFHYIERLEALLAGVHRALVAGRAPGVSRSSIRSTRRRRRPGGPSIPPVARRGRSMAT